MGHTEAGRSRTSPGAAPGWRGARGLGEWAAGHPGGGAQPASGQGSTPFALALPVPWPRSTPVSGSPPAVLCPDTGCARVCVYTAFGGPQAPWPAQGLGQCTLPHHRGCPHGVSGKSEVSPCKMTGRGAASHSFKGTVGLAVASRLRGVAGCWRGWVLGPGFCAPQQRQS